MAQSFELPNIDALMAPYKVLNELAQANVEKLVALQTRNLAKYSTLALNSVQEVSKLTDIKQSQAYFDKQGELSKKVAEDIAADLKVVAEMSQAYAAEAQKVVADSAKKVA